MPALAEDQWTEPLLTQELPRTFPEINPEQYHARPEVSSGGVRTFAMDGAFKYHAAYIDRSIEHPDSKEKRLGRAFHLAMADPENWGDYFKILPKTLIAGPILDETTADWADRTKESLSPGTSINLRSPAHRFYMNRLVEQATADGFDYLTEDQVEPLIEMGKAVRANPIALEMIELQGDAEIPCLTVDQSTGLGMKALADFYVPQHDMIVDYKTTRQCTRDTFLRDAFSFGYHYQAAWYLDVFGAKSFYIISIRNQAPYEAMVYQVPDYEIETARETNRQTLEAMKMCYEFDNWHTEGWGEITEMTRQFGRTAN